MKNQINKWEVTIKGISPIIQNNPKSMLLDNPEKVTPPDKLLYLNKEEKVCQPATHIERAIAYAGYKINRKYSPVIKAFLDVEPKMIVHKNQDWEILEESVVIQRNRVFKQRPMIKDWELTFTVIAINSELTGSIIKAALERAGCYYGLGDWRAQKGGKYGFFEVTQFKELK